MLMSLYPGTPAGYGITCVLEGGDLLEKAAANISIVRGTLSAARAQAMSSRGRSQIDPAGGQPYSAAALSLVFHAAHPLVPTLRADVRLFQVSTASHVLMGVWLGPQPSAWGELTVVVCEWRHDILEIDFPVQHLALCRCQLLALACSQTCSCTSGLLIRDQ